MTLVGQLAARPARMIAFSPPRSLVDGRRLLGGWRTHPIRCHAGAGHAPAVVFGITGALCWPCWVRVLAIHAKLRGS